MLGRDGGKAYHHGIGRVLLGDETDPNRGGKCLIDTAAKLAIERAGRWVQGAMRAGEDCRWDDVVYCSQMAVEHSTKAVLLALGLQFPRQHDVSDALLRLAGRKDIPDSFRDQVSRISNIVATLSEQRGLASYGFEQGVGVEYFRDFAPEALSEAQQVHAWCREAVDEILRESQGM